MSRNQALSRRAVLKGVLAAGATAGAGAVLSACGSSATSSGGSGKGLRVALGWTPNVQWAGYWIADDSGYYRDQGVDVTFATGGENKPDPTVLVSSGSADIGVGASMPFIMQSIANKNDFVLLGTTWQQAANCYISLPERPVRSASDLVGATILANQGHQNTLNAILKVNNLPERYDFKVRGYDPSILVKGVGNVLSGVLTNEPISLELTQSKVPGKDFIVTSAHSMGYSMYANVVFCKREFLARNRDAVIGFMRATVKGWQRNAADPDHAVDLTMNKYGRTLGLEREQQKRSNLAAIPLVETEYTKKSGMFRIDVQRLQSDDYKIMGLLGVQGLPAAASIVDQTVLDAVYRDGLTVR
ncbi:ABC transporter substrate-binding protein [Tsukamurella sp. NPDC003166]|uniref:ABC transporter substrate-binding protein n=1 Tax=Tsukamurella sp. NPDC003166 TaxID=3154444 RepID=UPI0033B2AB95